MKRLIYGLYMSEPKMGKVVFSVSCPVNVNSHKMVALAKDHLEMVLLQMSATQFRAGMEVKRDVTLRPKDIPSVILDIMYPEKHLGVGPRIGAKDI
jgi:hypothetical protein